MIKKLPAISLQATKNLLKMNFFIHNHFMEGCFMFQWGEGGLFFRWGASFLSGGVPHGGQRFCWGCFRKNCKMGEGTPPCPRPLWETLIHSHRKNSSLSGRLKKLKIKVLKTFGGYSSSCANIEKIISNLFDNEISHYSKYFYYISI